MIKVLTVALLFIIRIRFPLRKSISEIVRQRYGNTVLKNLRKFERLDYRCRKAKIDLEFLISCQDNGLFPRFLHFRLANSRLQSSAAYSACQKRLLAAEIQTKRSAIRHLDGQFSQQRSLLLTQVSYLDFIHITVKGSEGNTKSLLKQQEVQQKKLVRLKKDQLPIGNDPEKVIFNFSNVQLSKLQMTVLAKGLNYSLAPSKVKYADYLLPFELLHRDISSLPVINGDSESVKTRLKDIALSSFYNYNGNPTPQNLTRAETLALKSLRENKEIVIQKSDKGNSVVILNRVDYNQKMVEILSDSTKFRKLDLKQGKLYNYIINVEKKISKAVNRLFRSDKISSDVCKRLIPCGSRPGIIYGLGKVHKQDCPLRPILSAIDTPGYHIAKYLVPLLSPITTNQYTIKDSFHFAKEIVDLNTDGLFMASLDVKSLFTNIPLEETILICIDNIFKKQPNVAGLNKEELDLLLNIALKNMAFQFNGTLFEQIDGVAMGSPLGPTLANAFLAHFEQTWLNNCPNEFKPALYRRYVDDTFVLFKSPDHLVPFLNYMNKQHSNIEFTSESEENNKLAFLDITVEREAGKFGTSVYKKPTFSGVYSNFSSFIPISFKFGLIYTLLHRAYSICDNFAKVHDEFVKIRIILLKNGYCNGFVDSCITKFLNNIAVPKIKYPTVEKKLALICLPYLGQCSVQIQSRIECLFKKCLPQVKCRFIFKSSVSLRNYFPFKDRIPSALRSGVVYKFHCGSCNATYVGKTKRHFHTRISEHLGVSPLTGKVVAQSITTAVFDHALLCKHKSSASDFSILSSASRDWFLLLKESLCIASDKPCLNATVRSVPLSLF